MDAHEGPLSIWTIVDHPPDVPYAFVARRLNLEAQPEPTVIDQIVARLGDEEAP